MSKIAVSIKIDKEVKEKTQKMLKKMGLPFSTFINTQLYQFTQNRGAYLGDPFFKMSKSLERTLKKVEEDYKNGKNMSPMFDNTKDAIRWLNA